MSSPTPSASGSSSGSSSRSPHAHGQPQAQQSQGDEHPHAAHPDSSRSTRPTNPAALLPPLGPPSPSPSSSSSSSSTPNTQGGPLLANEILDPQFHSASHGHGRKAKAVNPVPERCFTFCTQSQDLQPTCRMFCLRRRKPIASQEEQLTRLRPSERERERASDSDGGSSSGSKGRETEWWNPFTALERGSSPYSLLYIKGSPEGVVGRYMEELEGDDGNRDFGSLSRGASEAVRRRATGGIEYLDWGEHGALLHLPLSSLLYPLISLPQTISRVLSPSLNFLSLYRSSFHDGSQEKNLGKLRSQVENGGAFTFFGKINAHYRKKVNERKEQILKQVEEREKMVEEKKGEDIAKAKKPVQDEVERMKR